MRPAGLIAGDDWCFPDRGELGIRNAVRDFFRPSLSHLAIEPGSGPNENWSQWSIVKAAGMADRVAGATEARGVPTKGGAAINGARAPPPPAAGYSEVELTGSFQPDRGTARA